MKKIALEGHFPTRTYQEYLQKFTAKERFSSLGKLPQQIETRLLDLGKARLHEMDEAEIDMQAHSLTAPGCKSFNSMAHPRFA
jgi:hypothetical protein